jgi:hypothetical protein
MGVSCAVSNAHAASCDTSATSLSGRKPTFFSRNLYDEQSPRGRHVITLSLPGLRIFSFDESINPIAALSCCLADIVQRVRKVRGISFTFAEAIMRIASGFAQTPPSGHWQLW